MLASITPLGQRSERSRWVVTSTAFALGATGAGVGAGALLGWVGGLALPASLGERGRLAALAAAAVVAFALDLLGADAPGLRRQVDERWRYEYRGWVYGLGYGVQLGLGVATIVRSAAVYVALFAAFLSGGVLRGAVIFGAFGAVRGLQPLAAAGVWRPGQLQALHLRLERWREPATRMCWLVTGAVGIVASASSVA